MTRGTRSQFTLAAGIALAGVTIGAAPAGAEIPLVQYDGWRLSTDGRVNTFLSVAEGKGLPNEPENTGAGTFDSVTSGGDVHSSRIRSGFIMNILGFTAMKEVSPNFKITTRVGLWMNIAGTRTKNIPAQVDPRELYGKIEGGWGSFLAGSHLSLFGRAGILVDAQIAHSYGVGYPCSIRDASGGACGMSGFGAPFPGFEPGMFYATPSFGGLQVSVGLYDPATIGNAQLDRAPLPRLEGETTYDFRDTFRLFASGFWQVLEGTPSGGTRNLHVNAWGAQVGGMLSLGPVMLGGAGFKGSGFSPITYLEESVITADSAGVLREASGGFGLAALLFDPIHLKVAGGAGLFHLDKNKNDIGPNPQLLEQNLGITAGVYQTTGPVHFALEYFRAQSTWYDRSVSNPTDSTMVTVTPKQTLNFVNAGMTIAW